MFIIESTDKIICLDNKATEFNGKYYYKALIQFPKGLEWVSTLSHMPEGEYEGYALTFDKGKVTLSVWDEPNRNSSASHFNISRLQRYLFDIQTFDI